MVLSKFRAPTAKDVPPGDAVPAEPVMADPSVETVQQEPGEAWETPPVWIDLVSPTPEEIASVEQGLSLEIPTRAEMEEIEHSSRLYEENGALFMTAPILHGAATDM